MRRIQQVQQERGIIMRGTTKYSLDFDTDEVERINKPVEDGERELEKLVEQVGKEVEDVFEKYEDDFENWWKNQTAVEAQAQQEMTDLVLDSLTIDGTSLRDIIGQYANLKKAHNMERINIEWNGPSQDVLEYYFD